MTVQRFRLRPVVVEAMQWRGDNLTEVLAFGGPHVYYHRGLGLRVKTIEGPLRAAIGDWIIRGVKGEFYPCKPDIFDATYEPVSEPRYVPPQPERGQL